MTAAEHETIRGLIRRIEALDKSLSGWGWTPEGHTRLCRLVTVLGDALEDAGDVRAEWCRRGYAGICIVVWSAETACGVCLAAWPLTHPAGEEGTRCPRCGSAKVLPPLVDASTSRARS